METPVLCHRCGRQHAAEDDVFYVVKIEAFADPTPPTISSEQPREDLRGEIRHLIEQASELSELELMDQVYRRLTLQLCGNCYRDWIEDPVG